MVSGAISDSDTYVGGPWFVRWRSVVRTVSVRGSYGFGPWFVRGSYGFGPWFVRLRSVVRMASVRGSSVVGTISDRTSI